MSAPESRFCLGVATTAENQRGRQKGGGVGEFPDSLRQAVGGRKSPTMRSIRPANSLRVGRQPGQGAWLLLDPQAASTPSFLSALQTERFGGARTVVLLVGNAAAAERLVQSSAPMQASWVYANRSVLKTLNSGGTPVVVGLNGRDQMIWQHSGLPAKAGNLVLQMADWIRIKGNKE